MNYTVHGDAVNLAARLEQLNKEHGTRILISAETVSLLRGDYRIESMGAMSVRGKSAPVDIHALWDF
jgi:class 3 adenylate cyclase